MRAQHGYILLPVVLLITLVAAVAFMINNESALDSGITGTKAEAKQVEYVVQAGFQHALWGINNSGCSGNLTLPTTPFGNGSYTVGGATRYRLKEGSWEVEEILTVEEGLIGDKVRFVYCDDQNNQWFCSESDGIAVVSSNGDITYLTQGIGLSDNEVKKIISDSQGNLWLASRRGITKIFNTWIEETF